MARTEPVVPHKANFVNFVNPRFGGSEADKVDEAYIARKFQTFQDACFDEIPDDAPPADGYMYNAHLGHFVRLLTEAKYHLINGVRAYHNRREGYVDSKPPKIDTATGKYVVEKPPQ